MMLTFTLANTFNELLNLVLVVDDPLSFVELHFHVLELIAGVWWDLLILERSPERIVVMGRTNSTDYFCLSNLILLAPRVYSEINKERSIRVETNMIIV